MDWWTWCLVAVGVSLLVYAAVVLALVALGRGSDARAIATLIPDCVVLISRLARDPRVPRGRKLLLIPLAGYLVLPFDVIPDFIPVAGQLDDAILVALVLRHLVRGVDVEVLRELWPGSKRTLERLLRLSERT